MGHTPESCCCCHAAIVYSEPGQPLRPAAERTTGYTTDQSQLRDVSPADDSESGRFGLGRRISIPSPVRTAVVGLLAGTAGGVAATTIDPESSVVTVLLAVTVVAAATLVWLRWRSGRQ